MIAYDARGHGRSDPAPSPDAYRYEDLARRPRAACWTSAGSSARCSPARRWARTRSCASRWSSPSAWPALVVITPAYDADEFGDADSLARWDALAEGLRTGGVEGFVEAYGDPGVPEQWRETVFRVIRQRLAAHEHPEALADALRADAALAAVPVDRGARARSRSPTVVVADRDEADPGHPLAVGEAYAAAIPGAELVVEEEGKSPIAWQGSQLSKIIAEVAERADV